MRIIIMMEAQKIFVALKKVFFLEQRMVLKRTLHKSTFQYEIAYYKAYN